MKSKINLEKRIAKVERMNFIYIILFLMITGAVLNILAVATNGGRMPVKNSDIILNLRTHFTYENDWEVNKPYLTDRFIDGYFSIGDFYIIGGSCCILFIVGFDLTKSIKERWISRK